MKPLQNQTRKLGALLLSQGFLVMMPSHELEAVEKKRYGEVDLFRNCSLAQISSLSSGN